VAAPRPPYEPLEHTSEAGIIAHGATLEEAFANTALGMYALVLNLEGVLDREERLIAVEGASHEELLVDFLLELVFLTESEGLVFSRVAVDELSSRHLRARAGGERFDPARHRSNNVMVKAVTRHLLDIERDDAGFRVQVLFDI
jgi:SHS2 domain-containing protein